MQETNLSATGVLREENLLQKKQKYAVLPAWFPQNLVGKVRKILYSSYSVTTVFDFFYFHWTFSWHNFLWIEMTHVLETCQIRKISISRRNAIWFEKTCTDCRRLFLPSCNKPKLFVQLSLQKIVQLQITARLTALKRWSKQSDIITTFKAQASPIWFFFLKYIQHGCCRLIAIHS